MPACRPWTDCRPWTAPLCALLEQGAELALSLEVEAFAQASALSPGGSVGAQLRHVGDFGRALLRDLEGGAIDYDRRERDERVECDRGRARLHLLGVRDELQRLAPRDPGQALFVRAEACMVGDGWQGSTLARELGTLLSHTVHHYALIAVLLRARGIEPPAEFGVAPATLAHWREERAPCAPQAG